MRAPYYKAVVVLCLFFISVLAISFIFNPHFPTLVISGEASVGTWMSGTLLIMAATISLIIGLRDGWFPWIGLNLFFILLALDERFMFHERLKRQIIFSGNTIAKSRWVYELPVIIGACFGTVIAYILWQRLYLSGRMLLLSASILGTASVFIDILDFAPLLEDSFKLIAELLLVCALLQKVVNTEISIND